MLANAGPDKEALIIEKYFKDLTDPRRTEKGNLLHKLSDIVLLTISAAICGADEWTGIESFGESQEQWLRTVGDFSNGIPSGNTIRRLFAALDPKEFNSCFMVWMDDLSAKVEGDVIAIDGKVCRGADPHTSGSKLVHIVFAFSFSRGICLAQQKVSEKSNEITAVPELLKLLDISGCTVTADAMAC